MVVEGGRDAGWSEIVGGRELVMVGTGNIGWLRAAVHAGKRN